jgi:hypothetical protein
LGPLISEKGREKVKERCEDMILNKKEGSPTIKDYDIHFWGRMKYPSQSKGFLALDKSQPNIVGLKSKLAKAQEKIVMEIQEG